MKRRTKKKLIRLRQIYAANAKNVGSAIKAVVSCGLASSLCRRRLSRFGNSSWSSTFLFCVSNSTSAYPTWCRAQSKNTSPERAIAHRFHSIKRLFLIKLAPESRWMNNTWANGHEDGDKNNVNEDAEVRFQEAIQLHSNCDRIFASIFKRSKCAKL